MPVYDYKALTEKGGITRGLIDANTAKEAREKLRQRHVHVTEMTEARRSRGVARGSGGGFHLRLPKLRKAAGSQDIPMVTRQLATLLSRRIGRRVAPHEVLFDAPPLELEVQFHVQIHYPKESVYRLLEEVSPVVQTLARRQFDDFVKRVRIFVHPRLAKDLGSMEGLNDLLEQAIRSMNGVG